MNGTWSVDKTHYTNKIRLDSWQIEAIRAELPQRIRALGAMNVPDGFRLDCNDEGFDRTKNARLEANWVRIGPDGGRDSIWSVWVSQSYATAFVNEADEQLSREVFNSLMTDLLPVTYIDAKRCQVGERTCASCVEWQVRLKPGESMTVFAQPPAVALPLPGLVRRVKCPECSMKDSVMKVIIELNDDHYWPREAIADWLDSLNIDLAFPMPTGQKSVSPLEVA